MLRTADLLEIARAADSVITERTLEYWRSQDLLPRPSRTGQDGTRPVWSYQAEAADQLEALLALRNQIRDPNVLRVALWFRGHAVPTSRAQESAVNWFRAVLATINAELAERAGSDPDARWSAIQDVARVVARKRQHGIPRFGRQPLAERAEALAVLFGVALDEPRAIDRLVDADGGVERLIGTERGRRFRYGDAGPWLSGPPGDGLDAMASFGSLSQLLAALETATLAELDQARLACRTLVDGVRLFSQLADAFAGRTNASGMAGLALLADDPNLAIFLPAFYLAMIKSPAMAEGTQQVLDAIRTSMGPLADKLREISTLSAPEWAERMAQLDALPFAEALPMRRLLATSGLDKPPDERTKHAQ